MTNDEMKKALEEAGYTVLTPVQTRDLQSIKELSRAINYDGINQYEIKSLFARIFPDIKFRF